jgi:peptidoglycan/xylan/chitin deacetylase (PgdA/CDA1 family)
MPSRTRSLPRAVAALGLLTALIAIVVVVALPAHRDAATRPPPAPDGAAVRSEVPMVTGAATRRVAVPILMYHVLGSPPPSARYPDLWVSPHDFAVHVRALARAGYYGVTLRQVFAAWQYGGPLPEKAIVLSFDDGYQSQGVVAGRVLKRVGWAGVLNLAIRNAGEGGISVARLQRLVREGWEIDAHTVNHVDLTTLDAAGMRRELVGSRNWIRRQLGVAPEFFCYPAGRFSPAVVTAVRAAGYRGATTEVSGVARAVDHPYELPRVRVRSGEPASAVLASIARPTPAP